MTKQVEFAADWLGLNSLNGHVIAMSPHVMAERIAAGSRSSGRVLASCWFFMRSRYGHGKVIADVIGECSFRPVFMRVVIASHSRCRTNAEVAEVEEETADKGQFRGLSYLVHDRRCVAVTCCDQPKTERKQTKW